MGSNFVNFQLKINELRFRFKVFMLSSFMDEFPKKLKQPLIKLGTEAFKNRNFQVQKCFLKVFLLG